VGNPHEAPSVPCYLVTKLDQLIIDSVVAELKGPRTAPAPAQVIRTVGQVQDNTCSLDGGKTATLY
jgi:hypothetical protein